MHNFPRTFKTSQVIKLKTLSEQVFFKENNELHYSKIPVPHQVFSITAMRNVQEGVFFEEVAAWLMMRLPQSKQSIISAYAIEIALRNKLANDCLLSKTAKGEGIGNVIRKVFKKVFLDYFDEEKDKKFINTWLKHHSSVLGQFISKFYDRPGTFVTFFAPKIFAGEGWFEHADTCIGRHGENKKAGKIFHTYSRGALLAVVELTSEGYLTSKRGRCLVFFQGKHSVILSNAYYAGGLIHSLEFFVRAFHRLFNLPDAKLQKVRNKVPLITDYNDWLVPMYSNNDGILLSKSQEVAALLPRGFFECPHCSTFVGSKDFRVRMDGTTVLAGCADCFNSKYESEAGEWCDECGEYHYEGHDY